MDRRRSRHDLQLLTIPAKPGQTSADRTSPSMEATMLISTLPDVPGWAFQVKGLVFAQAALGSLGGGNAKKMVQSVSEQAGALGADSGHCVMTGTAVLLTSRF